MDAKQAEEAMAIADGLVTQLRAALAAEEMRERNMSASEKHQARLVHTPNGRSLRCTCGYVPVVRAVTPSHEDIEESMSIHLRLMGVTDNPPSLGPDTK